MKIEKGNQMKKEPVQNRKNGFKKNCAKCGTEFRTTWKGLGDPEETCSPCIDSFMKRILK